mgnify:CR=1 FL=1
MERFKTVKIASILGIIGNLFLLIIKTIIGLFTNSQAMIADAFNSAGDIFASLMTYIGNKIASENNAIKIRGIYISVFVRVEYLGLFLSSFHSHKNGVKGNFFSISSMIRYFIFPSLL